MKNRMAVVIGTVAALTGGAAVLSAAAFLAIVTPQTMSQIGWSATESGKASLRFVDATIVPALQRDAVEFSVKKGEGDASLRLTDITWEMKLADLAGVSFNTFFTKGCVTEKDSNKNKDEKDADKKHRPALRVALSIDTDGDHVADDELTFNPRATCHPCRSPL